MNYYFDVLNKYAVFSGRARRKEYWMFYFANIVIMFALLFTAGMMGLHSESGKKSLLFFYQLLILVPSVAVGIRRMHDVDRNGWYIIFPIANLILLFTPGTKGANKYGPDPKEIKVG